VLVPTKERLDVIKPLLDFGEPISRRDAMFKHLPSRIERHRTRDTGDDVGRLHSLFQTSHPRHEIDQGVVELLHGLPMTVLIVLELGHLVFKDVDPLFLGDVPLLQIVNLGIIR